MTEHNLQGKRIAFLCTDGVERAELVTPRDAVEAAGAHTDLVSITTGTLQAWNHDEKADLFQIDRAVFDVTADEYDGLVLPGGLLNPDTLRQNKTAVDFVRDFFQQGKPVAAICHGIWMLVEADVLHGRTVTSWPSLRTDIRNAGGIWIDRDVVVDEGLVTSRKPADLDAFCEMAVEEFAEGVHAHQHV
jgi:protease I